MQRNGIPHILIVYATNHGQTKKIAERLAEAAGGAVTPTVVRVEATGSLDPRDFDAVAVLGPVYLGRHQRDLVRWVERHAEELESIPTLFVSVSMAAAHTGGSGEGDVAKAIEEFAQEAGWKGSTTASVAGALSYRGYGLVTRLVMRRIAKRNGLPTDTSQDWEFTDWQEVERLGRDLAETACAEHNVGTLEREAVPA